MHSKHICEVVTLALQLICGTKYSSSTKLYIIRDKITQGRVRLKFTLPQTAKQLKESDQSFEVMEHSSDSDVPCTSREALQRMERRKKRRMKRKQDRLCSVVVINACRDFTLNPDIISYTINNGSTIHCSVTVFHIRFFSCTELIFPRLTRVSSGEYCGGKWLDLISMEFVDKHERE